MAAYRKVLHTEMRDMAPARWPSFKGNCFFLAYRLLPSMIKPMCFGAGPVRIIRMRISLRKSRTIQAKGMMRTMSATF